MKRFLLIGLLMLALAPFAQSQTQKGRWAVGNQIGDLTDYVKEKSSSWSGSMTPSIGYFVTDGLLIGSGLPLSYYYLTSTAANAIDYKSTSKGVGLAPYVRYYFGQKLLKPYVGVSYMYMVQRSRNTETQNGTTNNYTYNGHSTNFSPTIGLAYFLNPNIAFTSGLAYVMRTSESRFVGSTPQKSTSYSNYLTLSFGFQVFFGK